MGFRLCLSALSHVSDPVCCRLLPCFSCLQAVSFVVWDLLMCCLRDGCLPSNRLTEWAGLEGSPSCMLCLLSHGAPADMHVSSICCHMSHVRRSCCGKWDRLEGSCWRQSCPVQTGWSGLSVWRTLCVLLAHSEVPPSRCLEGACSGGMLSKQADALGILSGHQSQRMRQKSEQELSRSASGGAPAHGVFHMHSARMPRAFYLHAPACCCSSCCLCVRNWAP